MRLPVRLACAFVAASLLIPVAAEAAGTQIAIQRPGDFGDSGIWTIGEDGTGLALVVKKAGHPAWSPDGAHLAYVRDVEGGTGALHVIAADGTGDRQVVGNVWQGGLAWSPDGRTLVFTRPSDADKDRAGGLWSAPADGAGSPVQLTNPTPYDSDSEPSFSPDGTRIAYTHTTAIGDAPYFRYESAVAVLTIATLASTTLTDDGSEPAWSPDGSRIAFVTKRDHNGSSTTPDNLTHSDVELYVMGADGSNLTRLTHRVGNEDAPAWSPDSTRIAYGAAAPTSAKGAPDGPGELYVMAADGSCVRRMTNVLHDVSSPAWQGLSAGYAPASVPCDFAAPAISDIDLAPVQKLGIGMYWVGRMLRGKLLTEAYTPRGGQAWLEYSECARLGSPFCSPYGTLVWSYDACRHSVLDVGAEAGAPRSWTTARGTLVAAYHDEDFGDTRYVLAGRTVVSIEGRATGALIAHLRRIGRPQPAAGATLPGPAMSAQDKARLRRALRVVAQSGSVPTAAAQLHMRPSTLQAWVSFARAARKVPVRTLAC